jgi:hypothetical protein
MFMPRPLAALNRFSQDGWDTPYAMRFWDIFFSLYSKETGVAAEET